MLGKDTNTVEGMKQPRAVLFGTHQQSIGMRLASANR